jgi:hypothetical protein
VRPPTASGGRYCTAHLDAGCLEAPPTTVRQQRRVAEDVNAAIAMTLGCTSVRASIPGDLPPLDSQAPISSSHTRPEAVTPSAANGDVGLRMTNVSHDATVRWVPAVHELSRLRETSWQPALVWHTSPARHARRSRPKSAGMHVVAPKCGFDRAGRPRGRAAPPSCRSVCHHVDDRPSPTLAPHSPVLSSGFVTKIRCHTRAPLSQHRDGCDREPPLMLAHRPIKINADERAASWSSVAIAAQRIVDR